MIPIDLAQLGEMALACGFTRTGEMDAASIQVRPEVRDACAVDKCHSYGKNWSCPPACGSLEECEQRLRQYRTGIILQTTGGLEDSFDYESIQRIAEEHNEHLKSLQEKLASLFAQQQWLLLGSGCCKNCERCSYPQSPCRAPEKMIVSVEAMGIVVSDLCRSNNIPYYYGPNTLTYTGCVLL